MIRIVFLIHSLLPGGAERQLVSLVRHLSPDEFAITVVTFHAMGRLSEELQGLPNVRFETAAKRGRADVVGFMWRLWNLVRKARPQIIHGYMFGANELALLLARPLGARVVWGIRASGLSMEHYDWPARLLRKTGTWLSSGADAIISNSDAGRSYHIGLGYPAERFLVIPNGIDTGIYRHDESGRRRVRLQWQVQEDEVLIGIAARIDPMKDHDTFLEAAGLLAASLRGARFVVVGPGSAQDLARLQSLAERAGIADRVIWAGPREDMSAVYSGLDIATSSSAFGEGFSNSLAEAMACETPCVATDVGDARKLLGDTGAVVPPKMPQALAAAWQSLLERSPAEFAECGRAARARILENFSVDVLAMRTRDVLMQVSTGKS